MAEEHFKRVHPLNRRLLARYAHRNRRQIRKLKDERVRTGARVQFKNDLADARDKNRVGECDGACAGHYLAVELQFRCGGQRKTDIVSDTDE